MSIEKSRPTQVPDQIYYRSCEIPSAITGLVEEIIERAGPKIKKPVGEWVILDVGCGDGSFSKELAKRVKFVVGVEPYLKSFSVAQKATEFLDNVELHHAPVENLELNRTFDLAISINTVEHMPYARKSFEKVLSCLNPGGVLFLTGPNKMWPIECHYHLPFLSWLPLPLANFYLSLFTDEKSYASCSYMRTYWGMRRLFRDLGCRLEFVLPDLNKGYLAAGQRSALRTLIQTVGVALIRRWPIFWSISKGFIILIVKD